MNVTSEAIAAGRFRYTAEDRFLDRVYDRRFHSDPEQRLSDEDFDDPNVMAMAPLRRLCGIAHLFDDADALIAARRLLEEEPVGALGRLLTPAQVVRELRSMFRDDIRAFHLLANEIVCRIMGDVDPLDESLYRGAVREEP